MRFVFALAVVSGLTATATAQTTFLVDDFESYADTAALEQVWTATQPGVQTLVTSPTQGALNSDKYVHIIGTSAASLNRNFNNDATIIPSDETPLSVSYYIRADDYSNSRFGVSARSADAASSLLNIGTYNAATANSETGSGNKWTARTLGHAGFPSGSAGYYSLLNGPDRVPGVWTKLETIAGGTIINYKVDDVSIPADAVTGLTPPANPYTFVRVGLGVTANKDLDVDNVAVTSPASDVSDWDLY